MGPMLEWGAPCFMEMSHGRAASKADGRLGPQTRHLCNRCTFFEHSEALCGLDWGMLEGSADRT